MSYIFQRAGHFLLLSAFPVFFGSVCWYLFLIPHMMNVLNTTSAATISVIYLHERFSRRWGLPSSTRQVFISLSATTLAASLMSLVLHHSLVNAADGAIMMLIIYLCLRDK